MIALWVAAGVLSAAAAGLVLHRAARAALDAGSADPTVALYRRQLGEIDDLADRGLIEEAERKAAHNEAGRRLLAAADAGAVSWTAPAAQRRAVLMVAGLAPLLAIGLYVLIGAPDYPDQPFVARVAHWRTADLRTLTTQELAAVLRVVTQQHPDPEGYRFLALAENQSDNPSGAARALRQGLTMAPDRADLWEMLGVTLVAEADGQESPGAVAAFREALKRDPKLVLARFHLARAQEQSGDHAGALASLRALQADLPADDPRRQGLDQAIREAEAAPAPGAAATVAAAPPAEQLQMIRGMVAGLAARLQAQPDDPEGWERLVRAYAVLGDTRARDEALAKGKAQFAGRPAVLARLETAAKTEPMK